MKWVLSLATLVLAALVLEDKARQVSGEAQETYKGAVAQSEQLKKSLIQNVKQQPVVTMLIAGGVGYVLGALLPRR